jgi:hypothetical protein
MVPIRSPADRVSPPPPENSAPEWGVDSLRSAAPLRRPFAEEISLMNRAALVPRLAVGLFLAAVAGAQTTWHVQAGAAAPGAGTAAAPFPAIQSAIVAAANGDAVTVGPGTYLEQIDFLGKAIDVSSSAGASATLIQASPPPGYAPGAVVQFLSGEGPGSRLAGFTLSRGFGTDLVKAGGIYIEAAAPTIEDVVVTDCISGVGSIDVAAGVACISAAAVFRRCRIVGNTGSGGIDGDNGGVSGYGGFPDGSRTLFENCFISGNVGGFGGGDCVGVCCFPGESGTGGVIWRRDIWNPVTMLPGWAGADFVGCVIANNLGGGPGGVAGRVRLFNCTVTGNVGGPGYSANPDPKCLYGPGDGHTGGIDGCEAAVNCIVRDNLGGPGGFPYGLPPAAIGPANFGSLSTPVSYSNVQGGYPGAGNIDVDPWLVNFRPSAVSESVDGGLNGAAPLPATDFDGNPRVQHLIVDMGAFESPLTTCRGAVGLSSGRPFSSLRVAGGDREAHVSLAQSTVVTMTPNANGPGPAHFAIFGYVGSPAPSELLALPGVGELCFPPAPIAPWHPALFVLADNLFGFAGALPSTAAPSTVVVPALGFSATFTLQAVIDDSSSGYGCSTTNAATVVVGP